MQIQEQHQTFFRARADHNPRSFRRPLLQTRPFLCTLLQKNPFRKDIFDA